jgi:hypothetical protein
MDIENILSLVGADKLEPALQGQVRELIGVLIEVPENAAALERLLILIGADKLDLETQETVTENLRAAIDLAAKKLLENIGKGELERRKVKRLYLAKVNESAGDPDISRLSKQLPRKKAEYRWDHGFGSDVMRQSKNKPKVSDYKWEKDCLSPLSGKTYKVKA